MKTELLDVLTSSIDDFTKLQNAVTLDTVHGPLIHINNGGKVLGVGHLDWVKFNPQPIIKGTKVLQTPQLDDRLGVFVLLHILPQLTNTPYDILLCDSEEIGQSTAQHFRPDKEYNWIFEFDRRGTDVVTYDYSSPEWDYLFEQYGFELGYGSFSDISMLESILKVKGVNIGTGYHKEHTNECYAELKDTLSNAKKFSKFLTDFADKKYSHEPKPKHIYKYANYYQYQSYHDEYDKYDGYDWVDMDAEIYEGDIFVRCSFCMEDFTYHKGWQYCPFCSTMFDDNDKFYQYE